MVVGYSGVMQEVIAAITENYAASSLGGPLRYRVMQFSEYLHEQNKTGSSMVAPAITISLGGIKRAKATDGEEEE